MMAGIESDGFIQNCILNEDAVIDTYDRWRRLRLFFFLV